MQELKTFDRLKEIGTAAAWRLLVDAAKKGAKGHGLTLSRKPGRGLSNVWQAEIDGEAVLISIRTTRDRYIAFPPLDKGRRWKTLDDVQKVLVATVDEPGRPASVEVYLFDAADVRARFDAAYKARVSAGQVVTDDFGMWLALDRDQRNIPASVGTGIVENYRPIGRYSIASLITASPILDPAGSSAASAQDSHERLSPQTETRTVGEIVAWARQRIAEAASVPVEAVKLDLRIEYH